MAGHSAWKNIKHKKAAADAKRGKIWSKCSRAIIVAARNGGGDPKFNTTLRYAIEDAKSSNMPKDTIEKAIKKGTGETEGVRYDPIRYEGYAPGGVAIILDCLTDNLNRTASEIRMIFDKHHGNLAKPGAVAFSFASKGVLYVEAGKISEDRLMELALDAGAEDVADSDGAWQVTTEPADFLKVKDALTAAGVELASAEVTMQPLTMVQCDAAMAAKVMKLIDALEDHDDVQKVFHNADIAEEVMAKL
ncbi:MAG: YebC/PmpR family DNA-binding transcriptional regulator [Phycisphaerales bacterium]|nr:YebC/PmpR family DNA-binding transcriptional regulator [Phycisphaerales bacterium]MCI0676886.1 YebC/PmpR family DNA-binding transcriptional regulator [Phycisphaerales bacterium]